jgi:hypothetical protein
MSALVVTRTEANASLTTGFAAMDNLAGATVSSSFTVASNVSSIKQVTIAVSGHAASDFVPLVKISGNCMKDGDAVFTGPAFSMVTSGASQAIFTYDTDLAVQAGNSCEISIAATTAVTADAAVTLTFS